MTSILIPRSDSISAKNVSATDFEKYFSSELLESFVITGMALSAGGGLSVDVGIGKARVIGLHCEITAAAENLAGLTASSTNHIYIQINRDGNGEPESFTLFANTVGGELTDKFKIGTATTDGSVVTATDITSTERVNKNLMTFVGTGAQIVALSDTWVGMKAFCTATGSGFIIDRKYRRNAANAKWIEDHDVIPNTTLIDHSTTIGDYESPTAGGGSFEQSVVTNFGTFATTPDLTTAVDDSFTGFTAGGVTVNSFAGQKYDFGKVARRKIRIKTGYFVSGSGNMDIQVQRSDDNSIWTTLFEDLGETLGSEQSHDVTYDITFRYIRVQVKLNSGAATANVRLYETEQCRQRRLVDDDTTTQWESDEKVDPDGFADLGSVKVVCAVALFFNNDTDETEIKLRVSVDNTFTDAETVRKVNVSDLTDAAYNFIRFNAQEGQFIQIIGSSGVSHKIFIDEMKVLTRTAAAFASDHGHFLIDPTDATLLLDGT